ncbi:MAG: DUF4148 domain-containing protein [Rhodocyclaceae bacterium]|nr:DUF4148 domain-containing protein [Rhodocyclaceae bacterium]
MSKIRAIVLLPALAAALLAAPSFADTAAPTRAEVLQALERAKADGSYNYRFLGYPGPIRRAGPEKTRAQVLEELERAKADGSYDYRFLGYPGPSRNAAPGKTRAQVLDELRNISPEERARMISLYGPLHDR